MEIIFIRERQSSQDIVSQVKNSIISRIEQAVNAINLGEGGSTESLILPIIPKDNPFSTVSDIENYRGLTREFNSASFMKLRNFSWESIFPVNKDYSFQHAGSNLNGYDYVDFILERQNNILPFRVIAFDSNTLTRTSNNLVSGGLTVQNALNAPVRMYYDGFVSVKDFAYQPDTVGDLRYKITLEEVNTDIFRPLNWTEAGVNAVGNVITKFALQNAGLI